MRAAVIAAMLAASVLPAAAIERKALPAFRLQTPDGASVASLQLPGQTAQWVIVYVTSDCTACTRLIDALTASAPAEALARIVVIAGGAPENAIMYARQQATAAAERSRTLRAYIDADGQARQALSLTSAPAVIGVRGSQIEWSLTGVLTDPAAIEPVIRNWLAP